LIITNRVAWAANLAAVIAAEYTTTTIILLKTLLAEDESTTLANVIDVANEADYGGYARVAGVTFGTPFFGPDGIAKSAAPLVNVPSNGSAPFEQIFGYALVDAGVTTLKGIHNFPGPINIAALGDTVAFVPEINLPSPQSAAALTE